MKKSPFEILGVTEDVTQSQLFDRYNELRDKYNDLRFEPGEKGQDACDKLTEIEEAYKEAQEILVDRCTVENTDQILKEASELIRDKKLDEAQIKLNAIKRRSAYWHYLQGGIFYGKHWHNEAERELQLAVSLEPSNMEYRRVLAELEKKMHPNQNQANENNYYAFQSNNNGDNGRSYNGGNNPNNYNRRSADMCDCCSSLICADCCCECMGGDLISCC